MSEKDCHCDKECMCEDCKLVEYSQDIDDERKESIKNACKESLKRLDN